MQHLMRPSVLPAIAISTPLVLMGTARAQAPNPQFGMGKGNVGTQTVTAKGKNVLGQAIDNVNVYDRQ